MIKKLFLLIIIFCLLSVYSFATEIIPEFVFINATKVVTLANGDKVVFALFSEEHYDRLRLCSDTEITEFDKNSFTDIGLPQFIGYDEADVFARFPELAGCTQVEDICVPYLQQTRWSSQEHGATAGYFVVPSANHEKFKVTMKSNKLIDSEIIQLRPEYVKVKVWVDRLVEAKEIEDNEVAR